MKAKITTEPAGAVTYTTVANHLSTAVSELPDFISRNRQVSGVTETARGGAKHNIPRRTGNFNLKNADGTINTGHHENWIDMGPENRKIVNDERAQLRRSGRGSRHNRNKSAGRGGYVNIPNTVNQITQLQKANAAYKLVIASLKRSSDEPSSNDTVDIKDDAGNAFGGKSKKSKNDCSVSAK